MWLICRIDIYALLSASGTGNFVEALLEDDTLPVPEKTLPPISLDTESVIHPEEQPFFPTIQKVNQETFLVALQVGQRARELRAESRARRYEIQTLSTPDPLFLMEREARIQNLHRALDHCRASWQIRFPEYWTWLLNLNSLPRRVFAWTQHVCQPLNCTSDVLTGLSRTCSFVPVLYTPIPVFSLGS